MSRISFDPIDAPEPQPAAPTQYYNDGTVTVTRQFITLGAPYNQTYNLAAIQGVSYGQEDKKFLGFFMWVFLSLFGLLFGGTLFAQKSYVLGFVIFFSSLAILYKMFVNFSKHFVELKLGGLNNQILYMKKKEGAEYLAFCIRKAMQDLHTPQEPGQPVAYQPVFPDPVLTRN